MNPINGIQAFPDTLRSLASSSITGAYQALGTPLTRRIRLVKFLNLSSQPITISWDGVNDHDVIPYVKNEITHLHQNNEQPIFH